MAGQLQGEAAASKPVRGGFDSRPGHQPYSGDIMIDLICILDRSGSMSGTEKHVIDSFNEFIASQREKNEKMKVTLVLFDNEYELVHDRVDLKEVPELTAETYYVRGMTALNDAVGRTINKLSNKENAFVFIETDGMENASREYSAENVRSLVKQKEKDGWEFMFVGSDLSAQQTQGMGADLGILNTMSIDKTSFGYNTRNATVGATLAAYSAKVSGTDES